MACSLWELQSSDLWEANDKSPSNFNSPGAGVGHVLISISLSKNTQLARLALYNAAAVSSAATCQHSQRWPFSTVSLPGWPTRKSRSSEDSSRLRKVCIRSPAALFEEVFPLAKRHSKEKWSPWKTFQNISSSTAQMWGYQNTAYDSGWLSHCCPFLKGFRISFENRQHCQHEKLRFTPSTKDNFYCFQ